MCTCLCLVRPIVFFSVLHTRRLQTLENSSALPPRVTRAMAPRDTLAEDMPGARWPPKHTGGMQVPQEDRWPPTLNQNPANPKLYFELPPRRSASLPTGNPSLANGLQQGNRELLQSLQLGQYHPIFGAKGSGTHQNNGELQSYLSSTHESSITEHGHVTEPLSNPSSLGLRGSSGSQLGSDNSLGQQYYSSHLPKKAPMLSLIRQEGEGVEQAVDLAGTLQLSQSNGTSTTTVTTNSNMVSGSGNMVQEISHRGLAGVQAGALLRRHSAPGAILGNVWPPVGPMTGNGTGFRGSLLGPIPGDHEELSPAESAAANGHRQQQLSFLHNSEEGRGPRHQVENSKLTGTDNLQLGPGSQAGNDHRSTWERVVAPTIDFSDQLGPMPRGDSKKRSGSDLAMEMDELADFDLLAKKRSKSPPGDYSQDRKYDESYLDGSHSTFMSSGTELGGLNPENAVLCKARAKRGCATHPRSIAERVRRTRISENMKRLQDLVPNINNQANTAEMLEEAVEYMKFLKRKVQELQRRLDASGLSDEMEWRTFRQPEDGS